MRAHLMKSWTSVNRICLIVYNFFVSECIWPVAIWHSLTLTHALNLCVPLLYIVPESNLELRYDPDDRVVLIFQLLANLQVDLADHHWQIIECLDFFRVYIGTRLLVHQFAKSIGVVEWIQKWEVTLAESDRIICNWGQRGAIGSLHENGICIFVKNLVIFVLQDLRVDRLTQLRVKG